MTWYFGSCYFTATVQVFFFFCKLLSRFVQCTPKMWMRKGVLPFDLFFLHEVEDEGIFVPPKPAELRGQKDRAR